VLGFTPTLGQSGVATSNTIRNKDVVDGMLRRRGVQNIVEVVKI
jgi:hypothetical protein